MTALRQAPEAYPAPQIYHSDQGIQYAATAYTETQQGALVEISMAEVGEAWQNGYAERLIRPSSRRGCLKTRVWRYDRLIPEQWGKMGRRRFKQLGGGSFFGDLVYERAGRLCQLLAEVVQQAQERGVAFGAIQLVDSTHTIANVNVKKDERRQERG